MDEGAALRYMPTCPGCGTSEAVSWWGWKIRGSEPADLMTASELGSWLSLVLHRPVDAGVIRQWAHRRQIEAAGRNAHGKALYDRETVEALARTAYQQPKAG